LFVCSSKVNWSRVKSSPIILHRGRTSSTQKVDRLCIEIGVTSSRPKRLVLIVVHHHCHRQHRRHRWRHQLQCLVTVGRQRQPISPSEHNSRFLLASRYSRLEMVDKWSFLFVSLTMSRLEGEVSWVCDLWWLVYLLRNVCDLVSDTLRTNQRVNWAYTRTCVLFLINNFWTIKCHFYVKH